MKSPTKIALIDGDVLVYRAAFAVEEVIDWGDMTTTHADHERAIQTVDGLVQSILQAVGTKKYHMALTCHDTVNFRKEFFPLYKENRTTLRKPLAWKLIREHLMANHNAQTRPTLEGDDILGIWATKWWPGKPDLVVVSVDKDFKSVPCTYYNLNTKETVTIDEATADYNHMWQTLVGDSTDNYPGCQGVGPKKAHSILSNARKSNAPLWKAVVLAFKRAGFGEEFALDQARCARILRASDYDFVNKRPILWNPPSTT